ncbi:CorA family divalent cation transporter [Parerythrobacter aurantius]|uniref:CorA family divalent cation transporter n=1 Tax=Parerythrobacter aurantius TaxID=3127706 RepID=UPI003245CB9A
MTTTKPASDGDECLPLLFARILDGKGGGRPIAWEAIADWQPSAPGEVLWAHLCRGDPAVRNWLIDAIGVPEPTADMLTSDATRPRAFHEGNTLVATLRGINFNPGAEPEDMVSMQLWSDGQRVFTLRRLPLQSPREIMAEVDAGRGPVDAGSLVTTLVEHLITRVDQVIVDLNEQIDACDEEDRSAANTDALIEQIATIRHACLSLKRHMGPMHVALEGISRDAPDWFESHDRRTMAEAIHRLRRDLDDIDASKESAVVMLDDLRARAVAGSQRTTFVLTIVATIFMPLTFLTGLLGSNIGGIPGSDHPQAFWILSGLCLAILMTQLWLLRKWRWL